MAQPPIDARSNDVKTDSAKPSGAEGKTNHLYVQIADDLPQQFRNFNGNDSSKKLPAELPSMSLFESKRNEIPAALPAQDFSKERMQMFRGMSTIRCHGGNNSDSSSKSDFSSLESFFKKDGHKPLDSALKPNPGKNDLSDEQYKMLVEWLKDSKKDTSKPENKPAQEVKPPVTKEEQKVEPKLETKPETQANKPQETKPQETKPQETKPQENKPEEKKAEETKTEIKPETPKVEEIPLSAFELSIKNSGAYTVQNVTDAYKAAAKDKNGVALIIVGENTPGSKELLEKLPQLQAQNPELKFVVVNKDKLEERLAKDPNDEQAKTWKGWVEQNLKDCHGQPINYSFTSVQSLKADSNGNPVPERVTSTHWGANIDAALTEQAHFAAAGTARNAGDFRLQPKPEAPAKIEEAIKPVPLFRPNSPAEAVAFIKDMKPNLYGSETTEQAKKERQDKYLQALAVADKVNPEYLNKQKQQLKEEIEKENKAIKASDYDRSPSDLPYDKTKLEELNKKLSDIEYLQNAPSILRAELGCELMHQARSEKDQEKKAATTALGEELIRNAIKADPELAKDDTFDLHLFNLKQDTAKLASEANNSTALSVNEINKKLDAISRIGLVLEIKEQPKLSPKPVETSDLDLKPTLQKQCSPNNGCQPIARTLSNSCSGEVRACNAARQSNCQTFCQPLRQGNCYSRRPLLNFLRRHR